MLLADQDRARWDADQVAEGMAWLERASDHPEVTASEAAYLFQAAIAAEHSAAPTWAATDWAAIVSHYDRLAALTRSPVVRAQPGRCGVLRRRPGESPCPLLDALADDPRLARSHRLALARADALRRLGDADAARRRLPGCVGAPAPPPPSAASSSASSRPNPTSEPQRATSPGMVSVRAHSLTRSW